MSTFSSAIRRTTIAACFVLATAAGYAQSPWLPQSGQLVVNPWVTYQSFDRFWFGSDKMDFPDTDQLTVLTTLEYGVFEDLALDATVGYTRTIGTRPGAGLDDGLADTQLGVRYRLLDEYRFDAEWVPSVALRAGAVIEGTYEENKPESPGDGASGVEGSLIVGKSFYTEATGEFGFSGDVGVRAREGSVPEDFFFSSGVYKSFENGLLLSFALRHNQGMSGPDIGDPGFTFPKVKEIQGNLEYGIGYTDDVGRHVGFFVAHTIYGRNTGEKLIFGLSLSVPFDVGSPADLLDGGGEENY
jgi:hypothetical protein